MIIFAIKDKTQMTMLIMWLIELYLNDLGGLKEEGAIAKHEDLEDEFRKFLAQTKVKVSIRAKEPKIIHHSLHGQSLQSFCIPYIPDFNLFLALQFLNFFSSELDFKRFLAKLSSRVMLQDPFSYPKPGCKMGK